MSRARFAAILVPVLAAATAASAACLKGGAGDSCNDVPSGDGVKSWAGLKGEEASIYRKAAELSYRRGEFELAEKEARTCLEYSPRDSKCDALLVLMGDRGPRRAGGASAPASASSPAKAGAPGSPMSYRISFLPESDSMPMDGTRTLSQLAETLTYYPLVTARIIGYAERGETEPAALAHKRARTVVALLVNKYNVDSRRLETSSKTDLPEGHAEVEVFIHQSAPAGAASAPLPKRLAKAEASEASKRSATQHWNSGLIYYQKGSYEKAMDEWTLCEQLDPSNSDCASGLTRISQQFGLGQ